MAYNSRLILEQGASMMHVASGGSLKFDSGGYLGLGNVQILFASESEPPTLSASPGSIFFRSDGSASNMYVNVSDGTTGSVWKAASVFS